MATNERLFDVRTLERSLERGLITREDYENYLANLPDVADNAVTIEAEFVEGVLSDDDEEDYEEDTFDEEE
jgi:predicted RNA-binding protein associated with RNAse of E/G family